MVSRTSLAAVSGRSSGKGRDTHVVLSQSMNNASRRPLKHVREQDKPPEVAKTESIHSEDAAPASSGVFVPSIPNFSLERSFPSILATVDLMRSIDASNTKRLVPLAQIFLTTLRTIVKSMAQLPYGVRQGPNFELVQYAVIYSGCLLKKELESQAINPISPLVHLEVTIRLVDTVVGTLRSFLLVVEQMFRSIKPLPALPSLVAANLDSGNVETESLLNIVEEVLESEEVLEPQVGMAGDAPTAANENIESDGILIRKVVRRRNNVMGSLAEKYAASAVTLGNLTTAPAGPPQKPANAPSNTESFATEVKQQLPDLPYLPRKSAIYYLADPYNPDVDVDMPLPTGDTVAVRLDHNGVMKAASLTALVRILTSIEGVIDQDFTPTFFVCFRFFTSPRLFVEALIRRFDEMPPKDLSALQLEVWVKNRVNDHIRVGKAILLWLELYWKPEIDEEALPTLQTFVLRRLLYSIPSGICEAILQALVLVDGEEPFCRRERKAHDLEFIYKHGGESSWLENAFPIVILDARGHSSAQLLEFHSSKGREEFARQITIYFSDQFHQVDPEDAIKYWHLKESKSRKAQADSMEVGKFLKSIIESERSLCSWVTYTILQEPTTQERQIMLEFWLDIAARCMRLRNFCGAHCIVTGLSHGAITRLKHTVLLVDCSSKQQCHILQNFFGGQDNYGDYREMLSSTVEPMVPLVAPFVRDVVSALNVIPTSVGAAKDSTEKNMINLCSYRTVLKTVRALESCLIPYGLAKSDAFHAWLSNVLGTFPSQSEEQRNDDFYDQSKILEVKDQALSHIDPWNYTVEGSLNGKYNLHELPQAPLSTPKPPKKKDRFAAFFRKVT